ncbi:MAG: hypothetical protein Ct9H90mP11_06560 [Acidimicrobiales bacterium]|nr:MAG: hypothetical protein Ct9H90mP11_06560 [Acidimicrobiales bacterium]
MLELSLREALQLGHNYIGTEHILLGLIREGEGVAAQVLTKTWSRPIPCKAASHPTALWVLRLKVNKKVKADERVREHQRELEEEAEIQTPQWF